MKDRDTTQVTRYRHERCINKCASFPSECFCDQEHNRIKTMRDTTQAQGATPTMRIHAECRVKKAAQGTPPVPFGLMNEEWAQRNHSQSLARLNERGGMTVFEILANICRREYSEMDVHTAAMILHQIRRGYEIGCAENQSLREALREALGPLAVMAHPENNPQILDIVQRIESLLTSQPTKI